MYSLDESLSLRFSVTLLHVVWQAAVVGLLAVASDRLLRRAAAQVRYSVNVAALLVMVLCMPVTFVLVGVTPDAGVKSGLNTARPPEPTAERSRRAVDLTDDGAAPPRGADRGANNGFNARRYDSAVPDPTLEPVAPAAGYLLLWLIRAAPYLTAAYVAGVALMMLRLARGLWGGHRLRRDSIPVDDDGLLQMVRRQAGRIGLKIAPAVRYCERISVPVVVGVVKPAILLPAMLSSGLTPDQLQLLLTHELAHIRRYDLLVNLLQRLCEAILFFHPAVWIVSRRVSIEREHVADDMVLAVGWHPTNYAEALVRMAELSSALRNSRIAEQAAALAASGTSASDFKRRVLRLLESSEPPRIRLTRRGLLAMVLVSVAFLMTPIFVQRWANNVAVADEPTRTHATLEGTWRVVLFRQDGVPNESVVGSILQVSGNLMILTDKEGTAREARRFVVSTVGNVNVIDLFEIGAPRTAAGIYEVKGNVFRICFHVGHGERPTQFRADRGDATTLIELEALSERADVSSTPPEPVVSGQAGVDGWKGQDLPAVEESPGGGGAVPAPEDIPQFAGVGDETEPDRLELEAARFRQIAADLLLNGNQAQQAFARELQEDAQFLLIEAASRRKAQVDLEVAHKLRKAGMLREAEQMERDAEERLIQISAERAMWVARKQLRNREKELQSEVDLLTAMAATFRTEGRLDKLHEVERQLEQLLRSRDPNLQRANELKKRAAQARFERNFRDAELYDREAESLLQAMKQRDAAEAAIRAPSKNQETAAGQELPVTTNGTEATGPRQDSDRTGDKFDDDPSGLFGVQGRVTDVAGHPMPGVEVKASTGIGTLFTGGRGVTGPDGRYEFEFLPGFAAAEVVQQAATITAHRVGYCEVNLNRQGNWLMAATMPEEKGTYAGIFLPNKMERVDFVMARAGVIAGRLVDQDGQPLPNRQLRLSGASLPPSSNVLAGTETIANGHFRFLDVPPSPFQWWFEMQSADGSKESAVIRSGSVLQVKEGTLLKLELRYKAGSDTEEPSLECTTLGKRALYLLGSDRATSDPRQFSFDRMIPHDVLRGFGFHYDLVEALVS